MLEASDTLLTVAEIAVAFAGFASIASVLASRRKAIDPRVNALRLHNMVDIGLCVVVLALAPVLVAELVANLSPEHGWVWRITSAFAFFWAGATYLRLNRRSKPLETAAGYDKRGHTLLTGVACVGLLSVASNVVLPAHDYMYAAYLAGVFAALLACGILFMRIVNALLDIEVTEPEDDS